MVDALNRRVQEMHVESINIFQSDLRQQIVNSLVEDELYVQIKGKLEQHIFKRGMMIIICKRMEFLFIKIEFIF